MLQIEANAFRDCLRVAEQHIDCGGHLERRAIHAAGHLHLHAGIKRFQPEYLRLELAPDRVVTHAQIDGDMAMLRNDVRRGAAGDHANRRGDAPLVVGEPLDRQDLPRHLLDGAATVLMTRAGMRRNAERRHLEAADALA